MTEKLSPTQNKTPDTPPQKSCGINNDNNDAPALSTGWLDELVGYHLRRAQSRVFDDFVKSMADDAITPGQFGVLSIISENPGLNQSSLAKTIGIERSTMVGVIDGLERRGLVTRTRSETDKRSYVLALSHQGAQQLKHTREKVSDHERRMTESLSAKERRQLIRLLKKIR